MKKKRRHKCKHCSSLYHQNKRAKSRQKYCSSPDCRKASKVASQRKWLSKSENRDYFRGPEQVARVQEYWKSHPRPARKKRGASVALQEKITSQPVAEQQDNGPLIPSALQDEFLMQPSVLLGVISSLTGSALQDEIASQVQKFQSRGQQIRDMVSGFAGGIDHDRKARVGTGSFASSA